MQNDFTMKKTIRNLLAAALSLAILACFHGTQNILLATAMSLSIMCIWIGKACRERDMGAHAWQGTIVRLCAALFAMIFAVSLATAVMAGQKGMPLGQITETKGTRSLVRMLAACPTEDKLPETSGNMTVIIYRVGCPDCEALYPEFLERTKGMDDVYWVSSRSRQGIALRKGCPVSSVPAILQFTSDGTHTVFYPCLHEPDGAPYLDTGTWERVLEAKSR